MKRFFVFALCFFELIYTGVFGGSATGTEYQWYCVHRAGHVQPQIDERLAFVEELGALYVDRAHSENDADEKVIYLTFDAGYENGNVSRILDVLKEESVTGAFFILGNLITKNTELVKRMASEGHTVCNHTVRHKNMAKMDSAAFLKEVQELEALYREHTGMEMSRFYRPPEGVFSRENLLCAAENGYKTVFWSFAYPDWDNGKQMSPQKAKQIILDNLHNGEIMLLHPTSDTNAQILKDVIREMKCLGYRFGTLEELAAGGLEAS